ncbi:MAG: DUF4252 domain-containing protein [Bacteroidales bacterium]|jgi:hypothetical protein|nr:DUF4252 domain-containing protein [Bacteroidales bacterium]
MMKLYKYSIKITALLLIVMLLSCASEKEKAKNISTQEIFLDYKDYSGVAFFTIPPSLVSLFINNGNVGDKELHDLLKDMKKITVLRYESSGDHDNSYLIFNKLDKQFLDNSFEDLAIIKQYQKNIKLKAFEGEGDFSELIVLVSDKEYLLCVSFVGSIGFEKVAKLSDPEKIGVLKNLERLRL